MTWISAFRPMSIDPNEVHLWLVCADDLLNSLQKANPEELLSGRERERAARLLNANRRTIYIAGRVGLKVLVSAYTGCPVRQVRLEHGAKGKPALARDSGQLNFNYSVSSNYALYAFSKTRELGIDLEVHPRKVHVQGLSRRILSLYERRQFGQIDSSRHNEAMLDFWTRKEAYGKLLGVGILYSMNQTTLIESLRSACWESKVTGLFDQTQNRMANDSVYGIQVRLPIPGSAALMYDAPRANSLHPELQAFRWTADSSLETGAESLCAHHRHAD